MSTTDTVRRALLATGRTPAEAQQLLDSLALARPTFPWGPDRQVCSEEDARAVGLDVAPSPTVLKLLAEQIVSMWGDRWAEPDDLTASVADSGAQLARATLLMLAAMDRLSTESSQLYADLTGANLARYEEEQDNARLRLALASAKRGRRRLRDRVNTVVADRDAQIIEWLVKKGREEGASNREARNRSEFAFRLADKLSRGAVRPPLSGEVQQLRNKVAELEAQAEQVAAFCAQRAEYVTHLREPRENGEHDYFRWTGHAEARRQLSQALGLPVSWPAEDATEVTAS
ncbi:hypothetical protein [Streptomyces sp. NPDC060198]|uniref:hypothetical protein n=1 Tax=Streptomyces sp. NPDC060198 TaxID=3347070 RepID=UPI003650F9A0